MYIKIMYKSLNLWMSIVFKSILTEHSLNFSIFPPENMLRTKYLLHFGDLSFMMNFGKLLITSKVSKRF